MVDDIKLPRFSIHMPVGEVFELGLNRSRLLGCTVGPGSRGAEQRGASASPGRLRAEEGAISPEASKRLSEESPVEPKEWLPH